MGEHDDTDDARSSSLSEIDDRVDDDQARSGTLVTGSLPSEHDSEAETERLENSPVKLKRHTEVALLLDADRSNGKKSRRPLEQLNSRDAEADREESPTPVKRNGHASIMDGMNNGHADESAASASTFERQVSSGAFKVPTPPDVAGQKRKRSDLGSGLGADTSSDDAEADEPLKKRKGSVRDETVATKVKGEENGADEAAVAPEYVEDHVPSHSDVERATEVKDEPARAVKGVRKGRRRTARQSVRESDTAEMADAVVENGRDHEAADEDDAINPEGEGTVEAVDEDDEVDATVRNEEGCEYKS